MTVATTLSRWSHAHGGRQLPRRFGQQVVAYPRGIQAHGLGVMRHRPDLRPGRHPAGPVRDRHRQHHPDPHVDTLALVSRPSRA